MNKSGFFLVETIIYLLMFSLIIALMLRMGINSIAQLTQSRAQLYRISSIHSLLQRFVRDIEIAPSDQNKWIIVKPGMLIWHYKSETIGWMMEKNTLIRRQGSYDVAKNKWGKKTKSVGAKNIKSIYFELKSNDEQVKGVQINVEVCLPEKKYKTFSCKTALRNRVLL